MDREVNTSPGWLLYCCTILIVDLLISKLKSRKLHHTFLISGPSFWSMDNHPWTSSSWYSFMYLNPDLNVSHPSPFLQDELPNFFQSALKGVYIYIYLWICFRLRTTLGFGMGCFWPHFERWRSGFLKEKVPSHWAWLLETFLTSPCSFPINNTEVFASAFFWEVISTFHEV